MAEKIIDTLSKVDRTEVQSIATAINDSFLKANTHAQKAIESYLEVGALLHDARQFFPGDKEYGQWRTENTTLSQSWANKLQRVHDTYGKKPPAELPISTLAELTSATPETRAKLEEQAADPEQKTPSVRDVKKAVKEEKEAIEHEPRAMQERKAKEAINTLSPEEQAQVQIDMPSRERIAQWNISGKTYEEAFVLLGLPCFFDGTPNIDTVILIVGAFTQEFDAVEFHEAYSVIKKELK